LAGALADPTARISDLSLMSPAEEHTVTVEWNATARAFPRDRCVQDLICEQAARTPDRVAVELDNRALSYAEMDCQANQLAHRLRSLGVGPDLWSDCI
jgi:non-ribosomal peptide synthetase component F